MTSVGTVYAQALYSLAKDEECSEAILKELAALQESFSAEPDFLRLLAAPNLSKEERCQIVDSSFRGKVHPYVLNFMKILTEKGYMRHFTDCCEAYRVLYNRDNGILSVNAVSAVALTGEQQEKLTRKLETLTGKTVELVCRIDPAVMGGVRLDYDGKRVDGTVISRLESISNLLKNTVL